ncbi:hypothetical protein DCS_07759 [Drechmeria coniospora]|uniref:Secreted protein n=1 Tax=Drechmeria coniospora TaxID=98403 RepID=A0A151GFB6_DRECN|nr:hypothetical protein DCS_07759 [Drechmeria coniospora]KYK55795.1 hypothetical protein DCS_07759 [Drechmeria coniospora]
MRNSVHLIFVAAMAKRVIGSEAPVPGYGVEVLQWDIEVSPGRVEVLNGTVQEVYAQALQINPNFKLMPVSEKRDLYERNTPVECGTYKLAYKSAIEEGIRYLRGLSGAPSNGPGDSICARVSCSYNSAIWWCSGKPYLRTLGSWDWIANSAQHIVNTCASEADKVSGLNHEGDDWSTFISHDDC